MGEFRPDHVVISTHPEEHGNWLASTGWSAKPAKRRLDIEHVVAEP